MVQPEPDTPAFCLSYVIIPEIEIIGKHGFFDVIPILTNEVKSIFGYGVSMHQDKMIFNDKQLVGFFKKSKNGRFNPE